ncbi:MAG: ATPase, T2SS/T4P/T4SS family, partial [Desulfobulbaceae bacterium]|nr:ATPase, T2SS/T4P/T4SS family [Desulfobulbaceae bacterium]
MYAKHFGLKMLPFENVPDPAFFFNKGMHSRIRNRITESLRAGRGLIVVTGPMGSGKTTLSQMLVSDFNEEIQLIWMAMPPDNSMDLFLFIAQELGLNPVSNERTFILRDIRGELLERNRQNRKCIVIVDESHLMSDEVINGIRLLNNLELGSMKMVQILLLGQEEILTIIDRPELEHFKQRIASVEILDQMDPPSIKKYINHRLLVAGGKGSIFSETGWEALARAFGRGSTPRTINSLCDKTLNIAFDEGKIEADVDDVYEAAEGIGLQKDVFFYKIELKQNVGQPIPELPEEEEQQVEPETEDVNEEINKLLADEDEVNAETIALLEEKGMLCRLDNQHIDEKKNVEPIEKIPKQEFEEENTIKKEVLVEKESLPEPVERNLLTEKEKHTTQSILWDKKDADLKEQPNELRIKTDHSAETVFKEVVRESKS